MSRYFNYVNLCFRCRVTTQYTYSTGNIGIYLYRVCYPQIYHSTLNTFVISLIDKYTYKVIIIRSGY